MGSWQVTGRKSTRSQGAGSQVAGPQGRRAAGRRAPTAALRPRMAPMGNRPFRGRPHGGQPQGLPLRISFGPGLVAPSCRPGRRLEIGLPWALPRQASTSVDASQNFGKAVLFRQKVARVFLCAFVFLCRPGHRWEIGLPWALPRQASTSVDASQNVAMRDVFLPIHNAPNGRRALH